MTEKPEEESASLPRLEMMEAWMPVGVVEMKRTQVWGARMVWGRV